MCVCVRVRKLGLRLSAGHREIGGPPGDELQSAARAETHSLKQWLCGTEERGSVRNVDDCRREWTCASLIGKVADDKVDGSQQKSK